MIALFSPMPIVHAQVQRITFYDKYVHVILFGIFTFLLIAILDTFERISLRKAAVLGLLVALTLDLLSEYIQAYIPGRSPSIFDFFAGAIGVFFAYLIARLKLYENKPKILVHVCCATCAVWAQHLLAKDYDIIFFFYNPGIYPEREYNKRLLDVKRLAARKDVKLILEKHDHRRWRNMVRSHESDPEGGMRCLACYRDRLEKTARRAIDFSIPFFTSTLTTSPHKKSKEINQIGEEIGKKYGVDFLERDFKKKNGFKRSIELSKKFNFYRQNYCGCEFSIRKPLKTDKKGL